MTRMGLLGVLAASAAALLSPVHTRGASAPARATDVDAEARVAVPTFVLIGGGLEDENAALFRHLLVRKDTDKIVIVPYASGEWQKSAESTIARFKKHRPGTRYVTLPDAAKDEASRDTAAEWIAHADLVYFTGGDQSRLIPRFMTESGKPNAVLQSLRAGMLRYATIVGGTSAGAAVMADPMFTGGGSESALSGEAIGDGEGDADQDAPPPARGVRLGTGFGLVPGVIIDTHTSARGRHGRMVAALEASGHRFAIGLNENRGVIARGGEFVGVGDACAVIVDGAGVTREGLSRLGVRVSILGEGDRLSPHARAGRVGGVSVPGEPGHYELSNAEITGEALRTLAGAAIAEARAREEQARQARERDDAAERGARPSQPGAAGAPPPASRAAWGREALPAMLRDLAREPRSVQTARSERFEVRVYADERTRWFGVQGQPGTLRVVDARMDVVAIR